MKRKVYGELSIRDYQRVLDSVKRREERLGHGTPANGPERAEANGAFMTSRPQRWKRLTPAMTRAVVVLLVLSTYAAGATWRWDGKWSRDLSMNKLILVTQDPFSTDDQVQVVLHTIRTKIYAGLSALREVADNEGMSGTFATQMLQNSADQAQELVKEVDRR